ncbi:hypothetical protein [Shewanella algae]|uniref:hypothetical protein n=1 Tax=Shewanella algae TaxID=38313 RepID=UPI0031F5D471
MIIDQTIKGGVCTVSKTGKYFQIINAGGVVRVRLSLKGSTVYESKMWVGMNLDKPLAYDTVEIYGEDAPIQIWAGDVSMNQSRATVKGATAIRTSVIYASGKTQLTNSDVTRTSVRVRSNKEAYIVGAGISDEGWKIQPDVVEEIPVSGVVFLYRPLPFLNFSDTTNGGEVLQLWPSGTKFVSINSDESKIFAVADGGKKEYVNENSGGWSLLSDSQSAKYYYESKVKNEIYRFTFLGIGIGFRVEKSNDLGSTFKELKIIDNSVAPEFNTSEGNWGSQNSGIISNKIYQNTAGWASWFNVDTLEHEGLRASVIGGDGYSLGRVVWTDISNLNGFELKAGELRRIESGKIINEIVLDNVSNIYVSEDGRDLFINRSGIAILSVDGGASFINSTAPLTIGSSSPDFVYSGMWLLSYSDDLIAIYNRDGEVINQIVDSTSSAITSKPVYVNDNGAVYSYPGNGNGASESGVRFKISVEGDISPARVEVMELLA